MGVGFDVGLKFSTREAVDFICCATGDGDRAAVRRRLYWWAASVDVDVKNHGGVTSGKALWDFEELRAEINRRGTIVIEGLTDPHE